MTHSTTKYMDGHALQCGGVIVDGGTFDWEKSGKFPDLTEPDESYHGLRLHQRVRQNGLHHSRRECS